MEQTLMRNAPHGTRTDLDRALALVDDADEIIVASETLTGALRELVERINAGIIDADARRDIGGDMLALTDQLAAYALRVLA